MISLFCFLLDTAVSIYVWILIIAVVLTYVQPNQYNPAVQFIYKVTAPVFAYSRQYLSFLTISGIDFSPIAVIMFLQFIPRFICSLL